MHPLRQLSSPGKKEDRPLTTMLAVECMGPGKPHQGHGTLDALSSGESVPVSSRGSAGKGRL